MRKKIIDISLYKNRSCFSHEEFIASYNKTSYAYFGWLTDEFEIESYNNTLFSGEYTFNNVKWHYLNLGVRNLLMLAFRLRKQKNTVLFFHGFVSPFRAWLFMSLLPRGMKIIVQHHAEKPFVSPVKRWFQKKAYKQADAYLIAARELANAFVEHGIISRQAAIHEVMEGSTLLKPGNKDLARTKLKINKNRIFLWVSRLDENKDPLTLLKAFLKYRDAGVEFCLYMVYSENKLEKQVRTFIVENRLSENVVLVGKVPHQQLDAWYSAADYYVSASHYEGSGIALCEAMACGCVPIVTKIPSFYKITAEGKCAVLFDPGNPDDLFKKLLGLDASKEENLRQNIVDQFKKNLSFEAIAKKIGNIANQLLAER